MSRKRKREGTLFLKSGFSFTLTGEDNLYYYCIGSQFRKTNLEIDRIEEPAPAPVENEVDNSATGETTSEN